MSSLILLECLKNTSFRDVAFKLAWLIWVLQAVLASSREDVPIVSGFVEFSFPSGQPYLLKGTSSGNVRSI